MFDCFSDSHHWLGCWWEPIRCSSWWNCVSYSVFSMHLLESCYFSCLNLLYIPPSLLWLIVFPFLQRASIVYYCRCFWWKELGISNIWENSNYWSLHFSS
jgi:hypothetical protein